MVDRYIDAQPKPAIVIRDAIRDVIDTEVHDRVLAERLTEFSVRYVNAGRLYALLVPIWFARSVRRGHVSGVGRKATPCVAETPVPVAPLINVGVMLRIELGMLLMTDDCYVVAIVEIQ